MKTGTPKTMPYSSKPTLEVDNLLQAVQRLFNWYIGYKIICEINFIFII